MLSTRSSLVQELLQLFRGELVDLTTLGGSLQRYLPQQISSKTRAKPCSNVVSAELGTLSWEPGDQVWGTVLLLPVWVHHSSSVDLCPPQKIRALG